jgi:hypothetical protein
MDRIGQRVQKIGGEVWGREKLMLLGHFLRGKILFELCI